MKSQFSELKLSVIEASHSSLFNNDIFSNRDEEKKTLVKIVNNYHDNKQVVSGTKLLYKYDSQNQVDFHSQIDNVESILVVVETKNTIIGGYYAGCIGEKEPSGKSSFLFSVKERDFFPCIAPKHAVTYDKSSIIFGSSELKITPANKHIFSNFAFMTSYFDKKNKTLTRFLREGEEREAAFTKLEIYQVAFSDPNNHRLASKFLSGILS